ncbi:hypothetical protein [Streptomyces antibioticus]|uniref:hypothetical protein n=1 Tax=Streptomyces antibioticus TaxID=1890 RepID=UPI0033F018A7
MLISSPVSIELSVNSNHSTRRRRTRSPPRPVTARGRRSSRCSAGAPGPVGPGRAGSAQPVTAARPGLPQAVGDGEALVPGRRGQHPQRPRGVRRPHP